MIIKQRLVKTQFHLIIMTFMLMLIGFAVHGQEVIDSTADEVIIKKEKKGSIFAGRPGKAFALSMILPGTGQIYNKSYLRLPFVYGAVGGMGAVMVINIKQYNCLKEAYKVNIDGGVFVPTDNTEFCKDVAEIHDPARLRALRDQANANRQLAIIGFALVWLAQGIDAYVDAHLKEFNISDDLSIDFGSKASENSYAPVNFGMYVSF